MDNSDEPILRKPTLEEEAKLVGDWIRKQSDENLIVFYVTGLSTLQQCGMQRAFEQLRNMRADLEKLGVRYGKVKPTTDNTGD